MMGVTLFCNPAEYIHRRPRPGFPWGSCRSIRLGFFGPRKARKEFFAGLLHGSRLSAYAPAHGELSPQKYNPPHIECFRPPRDPPDLFSTIRLWTHGIPGSGSPSAPASGHCHAARRTPEPRPLAQPAKASEHCPTGGKGIADAAGRGPPPPRWHVALAFPWPSPSQTVTQPHLAIRPPKLQPGCAGQ